MPVRLYRWYWAAALVTVAVSLFHDAKYSWDTLGAIRLTDEEGQDKDVAHEDSSYDPQRLRKAAYVACGVTIFSCSLLCSSYVIEVS